MGFAVWFFFSLLLALFYGPAVLSAVIHSSRTASQGQVLLFGAGAASLSTCVATAAGLFG